MALAHEGREAVQKRQAAMGWQLSEQKNHSSARSEQGLGDCLQFIRYAALVKKRGARVVLQCPNPLVRLFSMLPEIDQVVVQDESIPEHDFFAPLMSLPAIFGTVLDNIPHSVPYLYPDTHEIQAWAGRFGAG